MSEVNAVNVYEIFRRQEHSKHFLKFVFFLKVAANIRQLTEIGCWSPKLRSHRLCFALKINKTKTLRRSVLVLVFNHWSYFVEMKLPLPSVNK